MRSTYLAKKSEVEKKWYIVDATGIPLGRLSSVVASILRGKNKPIYTPNVDTGDNVIIINAGKIALTGRKATKKMYYRHSRYPGGLKSITAGQLLKQHPVGLVENSIRSMLPHKTTLARQQLLKLHVYAGSDHPHQSQKPEVLDIKSMI